MVFTSEEYNQGFQFMQPKSFCSVYHFTDDRDIDRVRQMVLVGEAGIFNQPTSAGFAIWLAEVLQSAYADPYSCLCVCMG